MRNTDTLRRTGALSARLGIFLAATLAGFSGAQAQQSITIRHGEPEAFRYTAIALCRAVERSTAHSCEAAPPDAAAANDTATLAILYADDVSPASDPRALTPLFVEPTAVVARADAGIAAFGELQNRRVNIGAADTLPRAVMEQLIANAGWTTDAFSVATGLDAEAQTVALCENQLDAGIMILRDRDDAPGCDVVIVEVSAEAAGDLARTSIDRGDGEVVTTVGRRVELVTESDTDALLVRDIVGAIAANLGRIGAATALTLEEMAAGGAVPLHDGAVLFHNPPPPAEDEIAADGDDATTDP